MESKAPPSAGFYDFLGWLDVNKQRLAIAAVIMAFVGLIIGWFVWRSGQREIEAAQALSAVRLPFNPTEPPPPGTAEGFLKVATEFSGTRAAAQAVLRAGSAYFAEGNYAQAQKQFEDFVRQHGDTPWVPQAVFGIAASLDAQGKSPEAISKYNDFLRSYANDPAADQARLNLARLYEASNQPAQAADMLNKVTSAGPMTPMAGEAQERLRALQAKHPELMATNVLSRQPAPAPMRTNAVVMTNRITVTNPASNPTGAAPKIILQPPGN